ncbi:MAG: invertase protein [Parcubacteria group bacterium GW2011_GWF2_38_76]|nr:MAG: invertase protein [Parcubacteria group bacterium GW2011_GWF2_38_76]HBM46099.1 hypothetical protein [Patescibacteria group bacterium]
MAILNKDIKFIAVYGRVSTSTQEEEQTIRSQMDAIREFAKKNGYEIVQIYEDEGYSGDVLERPALDQLRLDAKNKMWDAVLFYDPDRLARRYYYQELVMDELRSLGIESLFVTIPPAKNEEDVLMYGIRGVFSQYERKKISERFRMGKLRKAREGHIIGTEAPYGLTYVHKTKDEQGYNKINDAEIDNLRLIFKLADDGYTIRGIIKKLQELGIPPRKSKRGVWNTSTLITLLRNRAYVGKSHFGASYAVEPVNPIKKCKYKKIKKTSRKFHPEDKWIIIPTPKVINEDLFDRVQEKLKVNKLNADRSTKYEYLLSKKIHCFCGCTRSGAGPQKGKNLYYRCNDRIYKFPLPATCEEGGMNAKVADKLVWREIEKLITSPEVMRWHIERWKNGRPAKIKAPLVNVESLKKEINKLTKEADRYTQLFGAGLLDIDSYKKHTDPVNDKVKLLNEQIQKANQEPQIPDDVFLPSDEGIEMLAKDSAELVKDLSFVRKQAIVRGIVDRAVGNKQMIQVSGFIPVPISYGRIPFSVDAFKPSPFLLDNVNFCAKYRNCRITKRREINAV